MIIKKYWRKDKRITLKNGDMVYDIPHLYGFAFYSNQDEYTAYLPIPFNVAVYYFLKFINWLRFDFHNKNKD